MTNDGMFRDSAENGHEKARRVTKSFRVFLRLFVADVGPWQVELLWLR